MLVVRLREKAAKKKFIEIISAYTYFYGKNPRALSYQIFLQHSSDQANHKI